MVSFGTIDGLDNKLTENARKTQNNLITHLYYVNFDTFQKFQPDITFETFLSFARFHHIPISS